MSNAERSLITRIPRQIRYAGYSALTLAAGLAVTACGGSEAKAGDQPTISPPARTAEVLSTATATATPEIVLSSGQLTSLTETALMQIVPKPYSELVKSQEKGSGVVLSNQEREILNFYQSVQSTSQVIEGLRNGDPEVNPTNFINSLGSTATFAARLYCQSPNPELASLFYTVRDYAQQSVKKFVADGKFPSNSWDSLVRVHYTPSCPIPRGK